MYKRESLLLLLVFSSVFNGYGGIPTRLLVSLIWPTRSTLLTAFFWLMSETELATMFLLLLSEVGIWPFRMIHSINNVVSDKHERAGIMHLKNVIWLERDMHEIRNTMYINSTTCGWFGLLEPDHQWISCPSIELCEHCFYYLLCITSNFELGCSVFTSGDCEIFDWRQ